MKTTGSPPLKKDLGEDRREQIIDVALAVFSEKGFDGATIKDLADSAHMAPGLLYHYFESKEALLLAIVEERGFLQELASVLDPNKEAPCSVVLKELAESYYRLMVEKQDLVRIFCREAMTNPVLNKGWIEHINSGIGIVARFIASRVASGELRPHNTEVSARLLLHPIAMMQLTGAKPELIHELVSCLLNGISAQQETESKRPHKKRATRKGAM